MKSIFYCTVLSLFCASCHKNTARPIEEISSKYQPLEIGFQWTYDVDSTYFYGNVSQEPDTFRHQIKNTITSSFTSGQDISYVIDQYRRLDTTSAWSFVRTFTETKSSSDVKRNIASTIEVVLVFPLLQNYLWDLNQYNTFEYEECHFENIHTASLIGPTYYDSTASVYCEKSVNLLKSQFTREVFAANYGLVYKEVEDLTGLSSTAGAKGPKYTWKLNRFEN